MLSRYRDKMSFADLVRDVGADYIRHKDLDDMTVRYGTGDFGDLYILQFSEAAQSNRAGPKNCKRL